MINEKTGAEFEFLMPKLISSRIYPEFFQLRNSDRIVNLGCGNSPQAIAYRGQFAKMVGVDINEDRISNSIRAANYFGVENYEAVCANVEHTPLDDGSFDKAIAVDIIEHVENPAQFCAEINRLLKDDGQLLITFPTMHDKFIHSASRAERFLLRRKGRHDHSSSEWNPDAHNSEYSRKDWFSIVENAGFNLSRAKATTMFPPLHHYGVPKFWFSNDLIHAIDSQFCKLPIVKNYGQGLLCVFTKVNQK